MSPADVIFILLLGLAVFFILRSLRKQKRQNPDGCAGCPGCAYRPDCSSAPKGPDEPGGKPQ